MGHLPGLTPVLRVEPARPEGRTVASADPDIRSLAASIAVNADLSRLDADGRFARTAPARQARWQKYLDRVDPDRTMTPADRERAARHALREDMARLSLVAVKARKELAELAASGERAS